jgi:hypothetical protein
MQENLKRNQRMIRKQFFITEEQNRRLKTEAARLGVAEADLIRAGIDLRLAQGAQEQDAQEVDWKKALDRISGVWAERDDLEHFFKQRRATWKTRRKRLGLSAKGE